MKEAILQKSQDLMKSLYLTIPMMKWEESYISLWEKDAFSHLSMKEIKQQMLMKRDLPLNISMIIEEICFVWKTLLQNMKQSMMPMIE